MKDGGPAFPLICQDMSKYQVVESGMSLRDWFAGMALIGLMSRGPFSLDGVAQVAFEEADAMIAEREKK